MTKPKLVVLSGAGISAESGIPTFRGVDGLWEGHDVMEVASPQGWAANPGLVLEFYNQRRKVALSAKPNQGHLVLAELEKWFGVTVVTQNVDNLHEKGGSSKVLHLHGELFKSRSLIDDQLIYPVEGWRLNLGDCCEKGSQLRPHIVWFGEEVPLMEEAARLTMEADILIVVGTSLMVYPAAGLLNLARPEAVKYIVDPNMPQVNYMPNLILIEKPGGIGLKEVKKGLIKSYGL